MDRTFLKRAFGIAFIAIQVVAAGCDPGMLISQSNIAERPAEDGKISVSEGQVALYVKTTHQLIGEKFYAPEIRIVNGNSSPITVTEVQLSTQGKTYTAQSTHPEVSSVMVQPGDSQTLDALFWLDSSVSETFFRRPAELLVHYQMDSEEKVARTTIVGAHLDGSR